MSRQIALGIAALVVLVIGGAWYFTAHPLAPSLSYSIIETGDRQHKEDAEYYTIQINFPDKTPLATRGSSGAEERAQAAIGDTMRTLIQQFKDAAAGISQEEKDRLKAAALTYSLNVGFHTYSSGLFVSYEFDVFVDTGGPHPNNLYKTLVFDLDGHTVSIGDLFANDTYLARISQAAQAQVAAELKKSAGASATSTIITEGLSAKPENFQNFVVDSDRIRIFIPPYQAAAYAAGPFEVQIPLVDVKDILKPNVK